MKRALLLSCLLLGVPSANAGQVAGFANGNALLRLCEARRGSANSILCLGYVEGISDAINYYRVTHGARNCGSADWRGDRS